MSDDIGGVDDGEDAPVAMPEAVQAGHGANLLLINPYIKIAATTMGNM